MAISIIELPALIALLAVSPPAPPVPYSCQAAAPSDFDCCTNVAPWVGKTVHPQHPYSSMQTPSSDDEAPTDDDVR